MSRTEKIVSSPCVRYLQWKNKYDENDVLVGGTFVYWDKEKEENVEIELPFKFAVLEPAMKTFKGYNEKRKSSVWSNEGKDPEHVITLKNKEGVIMKFKLGDYKKFKDEINGHGAKYFSSVYIGVPTEEGLEVWNLQIGGAVANGGSDPEEKDPSEKNDGWFSFVNRAKQDIYKKWIVVDDVKKKKKGKTKFCIPVFQFGGVISDEDASTLDSLDLDLKEYFKYYFTKGNDEKEAQPAQISDEEYDEGVDYDND
jgi:hypothetical protein